MNPQVLVAIITGVFGAVVAPVVKKLVEIAVPLPDRARSSQSQPSPAVKTALMAAGGGAAGVFIGYFALGPLVDSRPVASPRVAITAPAPAARVGRAVIVQGTASNIPDGELWAFVLPSETTQYHPQPGPLQVDANGAWSGTAYIGLAGGQDAGREFTLVVALVDRQASDRIKSYLTDGANKGSYPGLEPLPAGIIPAAQITVVRQ